MPARSPIGSVNDFVVRFANVNGSGSASANYPTKTYPKRG
jgi:2-oxoglutarate/2-oxoacid ferredoxin oxidoreductase subunit alpha